MHTHTGKSWAAVRALAAFIFALGPALAGVSPAAAAAPLRGERPAPGLRPLADSPQSSPYVVNDFADTSDGQCSLDHCTLREAVLAANAAPGADEISLPAGTYVLDLVGAGEDAAATGDLDITEDLTLSGVTSATTIISGTYAAFGDRLFEIAGTASVTISNVALTGGYLSAGDGGGIYNSISSTVAISQVLFTYNLAGGFGGGGGLYTLGSATVFGSSFVSNSARNGGGLASGPQLTEYAGPQLVTITASIFLSNTAVKGVVFPYGGLGGGVYLNGVMTVTDSLFAGNQAEEYGGGISTLSSSSFGLNRLTIRGSAFISNTASSGGGLSSIGTLDVQDTVISHNQSTGFGGGLESVTPLTLTRVVISENSTLGFGGGIYLGTYEQPGLIQDSAILSNTATDGGGIYNEAFNLEVRDSVISGNTATRHGGGVFNDNGLVLNRVSVSNNSAGSSGGGLAAMQLAGTLVVNTMLSDLVLVDNTAEGDGGGVYFAGAAAQILSATVTHNRATGRGGGVFAANDLSLTDVTLSGNQAGDGGGGLAAASPTLPVLPEGGDYFYTFTATVQLNHVSVLSNTTTGDGGGLHSDITSTLAISVSQLTNNQADGLGGGLYTLGPATVYSTTFTGNTALNGGGFATGSDPSATPGTQPVRIDASTFLSNTAEAGGDPFGGYGGGVYVNGVMTLTNSYLAGNAASDYGGGLSNLIESQAAVSATTFYSNTSGFSGGGLTNQGALALTDSTLTHNHAAFDGGGLASGSTLTVTRTLIAQNSAGSYAGGLFVSGPSYPHTLIQDSFILTNTAPSGGGLYAEDVELQVLTTTIAANRAVLYGGGIIVGHGALTLTTVNFISNTADLGGGLALGVDGFTGYPLSATADLSGSKFTGNTAVHWGGGLYNSISGTLSIRQSLFTGNWADERGGGLASEGYAAIANSQFISNTASSMHSGFGGGVAALMRGVVVLTDSLLLSNTARLYGGGLYGGNENNDGGFGPGQTTVRVTNTQFLSNTAVSGGGLVAQGALWLADSRVAYNVVTDFGGGLAAASSPATITNTTIDDNQAANAGGGLYLATLSAALVQNSRILSNTSGYGGGIFLSYGPIQIIGSQILSNTSTGNGGGLVTGAAAVQVLTTTIAANSAGAQGGGVFANIAVTLTNVTLSSNQAGGDGGGLAAISFFGSLPNVRLINGWVVSNTATGDGGGLYSDITSTLSISLTSFVSNSAYAAGGGLSTLGPTTVYSSTFTGNEAAIGGGLYNSGHLTVTNGLFSSNVSGAGGGLFSGDPDANGATVYVAGSSFVSNTVDSSDGGGGLFNDVGSTLTVTGTVVTHNKSAGTGPASGGGGLQNRGAATVLASRFISNTADWQGGGMANYGYLWLLDSTVTGNAADHGGGLYVSVTDTFIAITRTTFATNTAVQGGGLESWADLTIADSQFIENSAADDGGGLYAGRPAYLAGLLVIGNHAGNRGGGLAQFGSTAVITASEFFSNTAHAGGGLYTTGQTYVTGGTILSNTASWTGGGVHNTEVLTLTHVLIAGNHADLWGGGLANYYPGPSPVTARAFVAEASLISNTANVGGGVFAANAIILTNVTLSGNHAESDGGGLAAVNLSADLASLVQLANTTIVSNTAGGDGGGAYVMLTATLRLTNTLLAANFDTGSQAPDCAGPLTSGGYNLLGNFTGCTLAGDLTGVLSNTAPLVAPLADNGGGTLTHALLLGSPALNAGSPAVPGSGLGACAATDQRGVARPAGPRCDLGAFESPLTNPPETQWEAAYTVTEAVTSVPFTATLSAASELTVTVAYGTSSGTATAGLDYVAAAGTLTFTPGSTSAVATLTLLPDVLDEPDETLSLRLSEPSNASLGEPLTVTLTILDDDAPPTVQLSAAAYTATEAAAGLPFTATLAGASSFTVTVGYATTNGTAAAGSDYVAASSILTFTPGLTQTTGSLTLLPDLLDEPNEAFTLTLSGPANATLGAPLSATLTLQDDDAPPSVQLSPAEYTVTEAVTSLPFTATLSSASSFTVTVGYATTNGTATAGLDYVAASGTLTFTPGLTSTTGALTLLPDGAVEPTEAFTLTLTSPANATLGSPAAAAITITDDDLPTVQFASSAYSASEASATLSFTVTLNAAASFTVTVAYSTTNGTATAGADYVGASGTLTFTPGLTQTTGAVALLPDAVYEPDETLTLTLSAPTSATLGSLATATATILNDDALPSVQLSAPIYTVDEAAPSATFTATLSAASSLTVTVAYATTAADATPGLDYVTTSGTLTFTPGLTATSGSVTLLPDLLDEPNEFFTVTLSSPLSATLGSPTAAVIRLADDDPAPTTQLQAAAYTAPEAAPSLRFTATLSAASGQTVTVAYGTTNGTAAAGQDYTAAAGQLTFSPGLTETSSVLTLLPDNNVEPDETFTVTLSSPANATLGAPAAASVTLTDDDLPTTQFSTLAFSAGETSAALPFTVTLNTAASFTVTVAYSTADGTALAGSDYVAATGTLNFPPGATAVTGTVTILPDELYEPNESFALNLSAPVSTTLGGLTSATATILNDDGLPTAAFTAADYSQTEISATAAVTVQLSAPAGITVSVSYATTPETATPGADYAPSSGTLTFAPGMTQTLGLVLLAGDSLDEADETLFFSLSAPVNATLGAPSTTRLSILDDDAPPSVQWQTGSSSAPESAGSAVFTATLSAASGLTVTVPYSLSGSATGGVDYSLPAGSLSFAPGLTAAALHPSLTADAEIEGDETLIVTLATPTNAALGAPAAHTLTILDVSAPPPTVQWSAAAYTATEESGALTLTATLSAASGLTVTVVYSATPGTALPSADYAPLSGTLTFAPGQTQRPVTLTLTNDSLPEPAEGLTLTLSSPVNATLGLPTAATVTIADADQFSIYLPLSFGPPAPAGGFAGRPHERQRHPALRPHLRHAQH